MSHGEKLPRMESYTFLHYLREINSLCVQADIAYGMIFQSVNQMQNSIGSNNFYLEKEKVWMFIMTFLALSGNVSKLLFPVKSDGKRAIRRGKELRRMIKVDENSIISDRKLRNDFEHFDARLDAYFQSDRKHMLIDKNIGDPSEYAGVELREFLRHFYPVESMIIFSGKEYDLKMMMDELIAINTSVKGKIFPARARGGHPSIREGTQVGPRFLNHGSIIWIGSVPPDGLPVNPQAISQPGI